MIMVPSGVLSFYSPANLGRNNGATCRGKHDTQPPLIGESFGRVFGSIFAYLGKMVETPAGPPFAIYHDEEFKEEDIDIEVCASTSTLLTGEGEVKSRELSGVTVASTLHMGPYDDSGEVWQALFVWLTEQGY